MIIANQMRAGRVMGAVAAALLCAVAPGTFAKAPALTVQQQRDAFLAAYTAAQDGQEWRPLASGIESYPLYPYIEAAALQHDIKTATPAAVDAYLKQYRGLIPAREVREAELRQSAHQKDWKVFRHFYQPGLGDSLTCDALQARLAADKPLDFQRDLAALWQQTHLPVSCRPVLAAAHAQGLLTPQRVWARIERAADAHRSSTVTRSAQWLSGADARAARRIAEALRSPGKLLAQARGFSDTAHNREAVARALVRLARHDSSQAIAAWQALSGQFHLDAGQRDRVLAALALYAAVDGNPDALQRLTNLPSAAQTDDTREWRVRVAVEGGDWKAAEAAIDALTPAEMQHDVWRYWKARIAQKLGHADAALDGYSALARQATFFGFLAADRAHLPYSICPHHSTLDAAMIRRLQALPGLKRAFEFYAIGMLPQARREWRQTLRGLPPDRQLHAAALASRRGWYSRAVFVFGRLDEQAYVLRFPLADKQSVVTAARQAGIQPAWAFAIIRAESAWQPDAHSGADARGLMQLLPATAAQVARRNDLTYHGRASLYDPTVNIPLGTHYLARLASRFDGSPWLATAAYNAGPGNVRDWVDARGALDPERFILTIPFSATRAYVTRVLSFETLYDWRLHGAAVPVSARLPAIGSAYDPAADPRRKRVVCRATAAAAADRSRTASAGSTQQ